MLASVVSSDDEPKGQPERELGAARDTSVDQLVQEITELRHNGDIGNLLDSGGTDDVVLFQSTLTRLIEEQAERDGSDFESSPQDDLAESADSVLASSLRRSATLLDRRANSLEQLENNLAADKCRNLAQLLRLEARQILQAPIAETVTNK
jgi:hypothetical protein